MRPIILLILVLSLTACGTLVMLAPESYKHQATLETGSLKKYQLRITGRKAGMMHTEWQMLWPMYYRKVWLIHLDKLEGDFEQNEFVISNEKLDIYDSYKGSIKINPKRLIIDVGFTLSSGEYIEAGFNGGYKILKR